MDLGAQGSGGHSEREGPGSRLGVPAPPASFRQTSRWQVSGGQRAICAARPPALSQALRESRAQTRGCPSAIGVLLGGCRLALAQSLGCGLWAVSPLAMQGSGWTIGLPAPCPSLFPPGAASSHVPGMPRMALEGCLRGHHPSPAPAPVPAVQGCFWGSGLRPRGWVVSVASGQHPGDSVWEAP